jgi:hypothetical protein
LVRAGSWRLTDRPQRPKPASATTATATMITSRLRRPVRSASTLVRPPPTIRH